jgi:hypothetical protein
MLKNFLKSLFTFKGNKYWYINVLTIIAVPLILFLEVYLNYFTLFHQFFSDIKIANDFNVYYNSAVRVFNDPNNLYIATSARIEEFGNDRFLYPPVSLLFFLPFSIFNGNLSALIYGLLLPVFYTISAILILNLLGKKNQFIIENKVKIVIICLGLSSLFCDIRVENVNILVLFFGVLTFYLAYSKKIFSSTLTAAYAFYLKLYPIMIIPLVLLKKPVSKRVLFFVASLIILPLVMIFWVSPYWHYYYFAEYLPLYSSVPLTIHPANNSLLNFIAHWDMPSYYLAAWDKMVFPSGLKLVNIIFSLVFVCIIYFYYFKNRKNALAAIYCFASLISLSIIVSITAWDGAYVMTMPQVILSIYLVKDKSNFLKGVVAFLVFLLFIPRLSMSVSFQINEILPFFLQMLLYFRYLLVSIFLIFFNMYLLNKSKSQTEYSEVSVYNP